MRAFKTVLWLAAVLFLFGAQAHAQPVRILMVETMPVQVVIDHERFFVQGLERLGYRVGDDVVIDEIKAQGDIDRARTELGKYLARKRPDIVVSFATLASQAVREALAGSNIPQVFCVVSDPVGAGLIDEVGRPTNSNITGLVFSLLRQSKMDLAGTLLTQPFPDRPVRIGVVHSSYPAAVNEVKHMASLAAASGQIEFRAYQLEYRAMPDGLNDMLVDVGKGVATLASDIDYWWIVPGPLGETMEFSRMLLDSGVPVGVCHTQWCTRNGGLFFVNPDYVESGFQVARMVDSILRGTDPGSIPPVPPDSFEFGVNLSTAIDLKIVVPSELMELAGEHIWH